MGFFTPNPEKVGLNVSPQHFTADLLDSLYPSRAFDLDFCVTRHPMDRLISEYRFRHRTLYDRCLSVRPFDQWAREVLNIASEQNDYLDNHLRAQSDFVSPETECFRFEDGLLEPLNAAARALQIPLFDNSQLPRRLVAPPIEFDIGEETLSLVAQTYAADFEKFDYSAA